MKAVVKDDDSRLKQLFSRLSSGKWFITVGIHGDKGAAPKTTEKEPPKKKGKKAKSEAKEPPKIEKEGGARKLTLAEVATVNEFGIGVPERSFIRAWSDLNEKKNRARMLKIAQTVIKGTYPLETGLERLALLFEGEVKKRISERIDPPNADETIRRKKSSVPLIHYGQLRSSIVGKVHKGNP